MNAVGICVNNKNNVGVDVIVIVGVIAVVISVGVGVVIVLNIETLKSEGVAHSNSAIAANNNNNNTGADVTDVATAAVTDTWLNFIMAVSSLPFIYLPLLTPLWPLGVSIEQ